MEPEVVTLIFVMALAIVILVFLYFDLWFRTVPVTFGRIIISRENVELLRISIPLSLLTGMVGGLYVEWSKNPWNLNLTTLIFFGGLLFCYIVVVILGRNRERPD
jgi:hypothetical protein